VHGTGERLHQHRVAVAHRIVHAHELRYVRDELFAPASTHPARRANEHARREYAVGEVRAARVIAGRTRIAHLGHRTRLAAEQGVHRHALAGGVATHAAAKLNDLPHVLVAQHEGKRGEWRG